MDAITYSAARANLASTMDRVCSNHEALIITRGGQQSVVMSSLEDFQALQETAYLLAAFDAKAGARVHSALSLVAGAWGLATLAIRQTREGLHPDASDAADPPPPAERPGSSAKARLAARDSPPECHARTAVQPVPGLHAEEDPEPQRGVRRDGPPAVHEFTAPARRDVDVRREPRTPVRVRSSEALRAAEPRAPVAGLPPR